MYYDNNNDTYTYTDCSLDCIGFVTTDYTSIIEVKEIKMDDSDKELEVELLRLVEQGE